MSTRLALAALAAAALSTSVLASVIGLADLVADDARDTLAAWRAAGRTGSGDEWAAVNARLRRARDLAPRDAGHRAAVAELLTWWLIAAPPTEARRARVIAAARAEQLAALAQRPTWAMAWARLAELDYLAGNEARAIAPLLVQAEALGPFEPGVQLVAARVGMGLWDALSEGERAMVERAVRRSVESRSNLAALVLLALHHGRHDWLRSLSDDAASQRELDRLLASVTR